MANISQNAILSYGKIVEGTNEFVFQTSSIYKDAEVSRATGIVYISPDAYDGTDPLVKIEQMIRSGKLVRLNALVANPVDGKPNKSVEVLCRANLTITARTALVGQTLIITKNGSSRVLGKVIRVRGRARDTFV